MAESLEIGKLTFEWVGGALKSEQPRQVLAAAQAAVDRLEAELINLDAAVDAARAAVNLDALLAIA
jgi:hypothetical protein